MRVVHVCNLPLSEDHPDQGNLPRHPGRWPLNIAIAQRICTGLDSLCVVPTSGASVLHVADVDGIKVHYVPVPARLRATTLFYQETRSVAAYVQSLKPDLVHAHGSEDSNLLIAQRTEMPFVFTAQALFFQMKQRVRFSLICRQRATGFLEDRALRKTRYAVAKSEYVKEGLEGRYPGMHVELIPNTFDERLLDLPRAAKKRNAVAFVGTIDPRKGVDLIVDAMRQLEARLPELELWIFGNAANPGPYEQNALRDLQSILGERLKIHGCVSSANLFARLSECKALLAPSREEMFGNQVIEALLAGTHVVVGDQTAMAENVRRFGNGTIVPQENPERLAKAVDEVLGRDAFPKQDDARRKIMGYMGPEVVAKAHAAYYRRILREWPIPGA